MQKQQSNNWEANQYAPLINKILHHGEKRDSRAGPVYSIFGESIEIDVSKEFPLLRGRKMHYKPVLGELAAMLRGPKHIDDFKKFGCNYWDSWALGNQASAAVGNRKTGEIEGPSLEDFDPGSLTLDYGNAWLDFNGVNQLETLVKTLQENPTDRRMLITGWRPDRLGELSLPCCHMLYQWYVSNGNRLHMLWYQRSVDTMVGLPSDIILCAAWNIILANQCGYIPGTIKLILGDTHIYANHVERVLDYMRGLNKVIDWDMPLEYQIAQCSTVSNFEPTHFNIKNYKPQETVNFKLNV